MRDIEAPVTVPNGNDAGATQTTHPAFAQIGASRVSGLSVLYGSDFKHQSYVQIAICQSTLHRSHANDWNFGGQDYIEVNLSEAQWATFVSSMNIGSGVPCTVSRLHGVSVPGLPDPESRSDQFAREMRERVQRGLGSLDSLVSEVLALKISQKVKDELIGRITAAHRDIALNTAFVAGQFDEHMEGTIEKAKIEINSHLTQTLHRAGLEALRGGKPILELGFENKRTEPGTLVNPHQHTFNTNGELTHVQGDVTLHGEVVVDGNVFPRKGIDENA